MLALKKKGADEVDRTGSTGPALGTVVVVMEVIRARNLVPKDRSKLKSMMRMSRAWTSDPFVKVFHEGNPVGRTKTVYKDLNPVWNEKMDLVLDGDDSTLLKPVKLTFAIFDFDALSFNDPMGVVEVELNLLETSTVQKWYPIQKGEGDLQCDNATGELELVLSVSARCIPALEVGDRFAIDPQHQNNPFNVAVRYTLPPSFDEHQDCVKGIETACVAINSRGDLSMVDTVYNANPNDSRKSIIRQLNVLNGRHIESFTFRFPVISEPAQALYFVTTVPGSLRSIVSALRLRLYTNGNQQSTTVAAEFRPKALYTASDEVGPCAIVLARLSRSAAAANKWIFTPIDSVHKGVSDFGSLLPELKAYSKDVCFFDSDDSKSTLRTAVVSRGGGIRISEYAANHTIPETIAVGLEWSLDAPLKDLDVCAVCLDDQFTEVDTVSFRQVVSRDCSITHTKDARQDLQSEGVNDEEILLSLANVTKDVHHIVIAVNSYSDTPLRHVLKLTCRLSTPQDSHILLHYELPNREQQVLCEETAFALGYFTRSSDASNQDDGWIFRILASPLKSGRVGHGYDAMLKVNESLSSPPCTAKAPQAMPSAAAEQKPVYPKFLIPAFTLEKHVMPFEQEVVVQGDQK